MYSDEVRKFENSLTCEVADADLTCSVGYPALSMCASDSV